MIVEIFSNEVKGRLKPSNMVGDDPGALSLADLDPIFEKMHLLTPREGIDVVKTSEGGYNLMLNQYGSVLRLYPNSKKLDEDGKRVGHGYHPRTASPIGLVQFDGFALQLMPGLKHGIDEKDGISAAMKETQKDAGLSDPRACNYGDLNGKATLLDTVLDMNFEVYDDYVDDGVWDRIFVEYKYFEDLQISFLDAWNGNKPFEGFWTEMEEAKKSGRLMDGWNHSHLSMAFEKKGNVIEAARAYEQRMEKLDIGYTL